MKHVWLALMILASLGMADAYGVSKFSVQRHGDAANVFMEVPSGKALQITRFGKGETIESFATNPAGSWLYVYHRPDGKRARVVGFYRVDSGQPARSITPGFGGKFVWSHSGETLLLHYGCGSGCSCVQILSPVKGRLLNECGSPVDFNSDGSLVYQLSLLNRPVPVSVVSDDDFLSSAPVGPHVLRVYDAGTGNLLGRKSLLNRGKFGPLGCGEVEFDSAKRQVRVGCVYSGKRDVLEKTLSLTY